jgi:hypothetical protein
LKCALAKQVHICSRQGGALAAGLLPVVAPAPERQDVPKSLGKERQMGAADHSAMARMIFFVDRVALTPPGGAGNDMRCTRIHHKQACSDQLRAPAST